MRSRRLPRATTTNPTPRAVVTAWWSRPIRSRRRMRNADEEGRFGTPLGRDGVPGARAPEQVWQAISFYGSVGDRSGRRRTTEMERVAAWPPRRRTHRQLACAGATTPGTALFGSGVRQHRTDESRADHTVVRAIRWQRHSGDFRCRRWRFVCQDGRLSTYVGRLAARRRRNSGVHRRQRHGAGDP